MNYTTLFAKRVSHGIAFCFLLFAGCFGVAQAQSLTSYVDPYIGAGGHGHVFVGASVPFGAVQVGPQNIFKGWDWCSGYNYGDSILTGFSHLHLSGTGIGDLGDILIMPYTGPVKTDKGTQQNYQSGYSSLYQHQHEKVKPGYYSLDIDRYHIKAELTASERVGFHRYHFPTSQETHIIIDLKEGLNDKSTDTFIEQSDEYTIKGYRASSGWAKVQQVYFAIRFEKPIQKFDVYDEAKHIDGRSGKGTAIKGIISFAQSPGTVQFKVGISPVNADNALANITAEIPHWDFEKVVKQADEKWNKELAKITIQSKDLATKRIFYTALYHTMIDPSLYNDANGDYRGADHKVYKHAKFNNYTVFSTWDTYRSENPLFTLTQPERVNDMINTMLAIKDEQGYLPVWHLDGYDTGTMVGTSSEEIVAEAYLKGFKGFNAERAFAALKATAMNDIRGLKYVRDLKPIPSDVGIGRPVANALEDAIGDGSIAEVAKKMGKTADYAYFKKRAENYKLYYDTQVGFFRGRMSDGSWNPIFDPLKSVKPYATDYAEGNAWQYLWLIPQDIPGLIKLLGGKQEFNNKLDTFFTIPPTGDLSDLTGNIGQYAHGNEPSHHVAYLYTFGGQQWKTAEKVRYIMKEFYTDKPDGIIGNEDCGQMSAWYIFSSMGFYPVFPASGNYIIGSPVVDQATIQLPLGRKFTMVAVNNSPENIYVQSAQLNGISYHHGYISHEAIVKGGTLKLVMGSKPNYQFGL